MKYRKKPVVVDAFRFEHEDAPSWFTDALENGVRVRPDAIHGWPIADIKTLEGVMRCEAGDWVIRGVKGELYPCKHDIFEATYEPA